MIVSEVGTGLFNLLVLFKVMGKPAPTDLLRMVPTVNLYILVSSFDSFKIEK
ncbi:hypothetical protein QUB61_01455 [Microcoleus sp. C2D2]